MGYTPYSITREKYKDIKKMDRRQMELFLRDLHAEGFNAGISTMASKVSERVSTALKNTPGIGEKRYNDLMDAINTELNR